MAKEVLENEEDAMKMADKMTKRDLKDGIQTVQYQINTLMSTNGQSPFVTLFMHIEDGDEYEKETAMIIEEILKQRIEGIKNEAGVYVTPAFPKLIYVLDENNIHSNSKYYYLTELAAKCTAKRMYPDYISAKKMKELYEGNVFSPMGCRSFLSPWKNKDGEYQFEGRFNIGVVSLNLPQIAILAGQSEEKFWEILDKRLELAKKALLLRYDLVKDTPSDVAPILWQHGAIARLKPGETINNLLVGGYATLSLGYIGIYEATKLIKGTSHTKNKEFALDIIKKLRESVDVWKEETNIGFALYGTPRQYWAYIS